MNKEQERRERRDHAFALLMRYKTMTVNLGHYNEDLYDVQVGLIHFLFSQEDFNELLTRWRALQPPLPEGNP